MLFFFFFSLSFSPYIVTIEYLEEWYSKRQCIQMIMEKSLNDNANTRPSIQRLISLSLNVFIIDTHEEVLSSNFNENRIRSEESDGSLSLEMKPTFATHRKPYMRSHCLLRRWGSRLVLPRHPQSWLRGSK